MSNHEKYNQAFVETFKIPESDLPDLTYQAIGAWDSVGHMVLMTALEGAFEILFEMDDILDFSSYEKGKIILAKYHIEI
jgi:acyl carrier protein